MTRRQGKTASTQEVSVWPLSMVSAAMLAAPGGVALLPAVATRSRRRWRVEPAGRLRSRCWPQPVPLWC